MKRFPLFILSVLALSTDLALSAAKAPNFVLIYVDDLGWADTTVRMMNSYPDSASDFNQTPHLARLAKRGTKFSCAYTPAPTCTPSRKSIQFGKTPGRLGLDGNPPPHRRSMDKDLLFQERRSGERVPL